MAEDICSRGDILLCEDWEWSTDPNFTATASDWANHGWALGEPLATFPEDNVYGVNNLAQGMTPRSGNCCFQSAIRPGINDVQYPDHRITAQSGPVYARLYVRFSNGYVFFPAPNDSGQKVCYLRPINLAWRTELSITTWDRNWDTFNFTSATCPVGTNSDRTQGNLMVDNFVHDLLDFQAWHQYKYACVATQPDPRPLVRIQSGQWYCFEFMVKKNSTLGSTDGAVGLWVDGRQIVNRSNIDIGANATDVINDFWITAYYGGATPNTLTTKQYIWYDNIVVSTNYIGPLGTPVETPSIPTSGGAMGAGVRYAGRRKGWR